MTWRNELWKSLAVMPERAAGRTSSSGSWLSTRKNFWWYVALTRSANASKRLSSLPAATLAQVEPYSTRQFSSSTRGCALSWVIAISDAVGNFSSPLWYVWKIVEVRPLTFSQVFSSSSRGLAVKPPAAAPQSTPQFGTSFASVTQPALGVTAAGAASAWAAVAPPRTAPNPATRAASECTDLRNILSPPRCPAVVGRAWRRDCRAGGARQVPVRVRESCS